MAINSSLWIDNNALQGAALSAHLRSEALLDDTFDNGVLPEPTTYTSEGSTDLRHTENMVWYELSDSEIYNRISKADSVEALRRIRIGLMFENKYDYWSTHWQTRYIFIMQRSNVICGEILAKMEEARNVWYMESVVFSYIVESYKKSLITPKDKDALLKTYTYRKQQLLRDEVLFQINGARNIWYLRNRVAKQILYLENIVPVYMQEQLVLAFEKRATELLLDVFSKDPVVIGVPVMA